MPVEQLEIGMRVLLPIAGSNDPPITGTITRQYAPGHDLYLLHSDNYVSFFHDGDRTVPYGYGYWIVKNQVDLLETKRPKSGFAKFVERVEAQ